ncbi:MAG: hypothetical protein Q8P00_04880, partial [Dehalococcoidia bacterium]|nr:hypothetical protein [Dehalococcoidia bacterium]
MIDKSKTRAQLIQELVELREHIAELEKYSVLVEQGNDGIIVIQDGLIVNLSDEAIQQVLSAKMESALILH